MILRVLDVLLVNIIQFLAPRTLESHGNQGLSDSKERNPEEWSDLPKTSKLAFWFVLCVSLRTWEQNIKCFQFSSEAQLCPTLCDPMNCSMPGLPVHHQLPELAQIHVHRVGDAIQPSHPLSSPPSPAFNLSQHQVFSMESVLHIKWPKYWSFSFSISPSNEYSGLISFRIEWLDILIVEGTLKSLLKHHSWKTSILWFLAFFMVQLSHPYMTTGKTTALTIVDRKSVV